MLTDITIRPSSIDSFLQCPQQWYRVFILGQSSIPNARAAIGTAIHRGVEVMWQEAMKTGEKNPNLSMMADAAIEAFKEEGQRGLQYDKDENENTASKTIVQGVETFADDVVPFTPIPDAVEQRFTIDITDHPVVARLSGTVDYIQGDTIADVKTSKRKPTVANFEVQQTTYRMLANANNKKVEHNLIQGVVLKKVPEGTILSMNDHINTPKTKMLINSLLDTTRVMAADVVHPDVLFRGNPKYYLCSPKYCAFYSSCRFVQGEAPEVQNIPVINL